MKISNAIKIATSNKALCIKTLLYKLVVILACVTSLFLFANIVIEPILKSQEILNLFNATRNIVKNFIMMNPDQQSAQYGEIIKESISAIHTNILNMSGEIVFVAIAMVLVLAFTSFLLALGDYSIAVNVFEHMTCMRHASFFSTLFDNFKKALRYAIFKTLFTMLYYGLALSLITLVIIATAKFLGIYVITLLIFLLLFASALNFALVGLVLPIMISEKLSPIQAFKKSFKNGVYKLLPSRLVSYFIMNVLIYVIGVVSTIITFFVALLAIIPLASIAYIALTFVDYYSITKNKYYITYDQIVIPKELRTNDEHLLNKVDID